MVLFFIVLATPFVMRWVVRGAPVVPPGAAVEPTRLVIVTPHNQDIRREFAAAFARWHLENYGTAVEIDFRNVGGTNDIRKLLENLYSGLRVDGKLPENAYVGIDIVWGGGDFFFGVELDGELGVLQRLDPQADPSLNLDGLLKAAFPRETLAGVKLREISRDDAGNLLMPKWVGVCLSSFGIVYNPELYERIGIAPPLHWFDLAVPELANLVALADPTRSGSAAVAYMMVLQRAMADAEEQLFAEQPALASLATAERAKESAYREAIAAGWKRGMGQLLLIAANARYFPDSANLVPKDVSTADAAAGMAIDFYGRRFTEVVGPRRIQFVSPPAATAITPDPVAILHGVSGEKRKLATRFVAFLLTEQGQLLWIQRPNTPGGPSVRGLRRPPVRPDVYADRSLWSDDVNPFEDAGGFNQRSEWMAQFTDTRPIWAAAWIDTREALKRAYAAVLRVPDREQRDALLAKLVDLPITLADVEADTAERRRINREDRARAPEAATERRMNWARKFRAHYQAVEREANDAR
ncbi:MAG TPA: ABC transporter substrate-binding protein [Tepidisphaeraceae bacterium]|nr:ABC transporter substrate-binding protein [Tepidisphaeraceae bacterium]